MTTPPGEARTTRVVNGLMAAERAGQLVYSGTRDRGAVYVATPTGGPERRYDVDDMNAWLDGLTAGVATAGEAPRRLTSRGHLGDVYGLLAAPSLADAMRLELCAAMEAAGLTRTEAAQRIGRSRSGVINALRYGRQDALTPTMAEKIMAACGRTWSVRSQVPDTALDTGAIAPLSEAPAEPAGVRRMRAAAIFHDRGLVVWTPPADVNVAARLAEFTVTRGGQDYTLPADAIVPWLVGLGDAIDASAAAAVS